jgi:glycerol-3-phosphate dehydrogenase
VQRDLSELASRDYDLVIVGGGIFGVCAAWDAALRGLSVALLEARDFGHAASANCFKMVHGGIRYLQHADVIRLRQSTAERSAFLRIAPHLTRPLPILIPTYGHGMKGKEILATGMKVYDLLTADRNRGIGDPQRRIPNTRTLSAARVRELHPYLSRTDLTGGCVFHDGQMYSPARLALAFLLSAQARGARAANHAEVVRLLRDGTRVVGVEVRDALSGEKHEVRGRVVLNATGGWAPGLLSAALGRPLSAPPTFSRDACFLIRRELPGPYALAVSGGTRDPDAIFSREARHLFLVPWRGVTLVGVWHKVYPGDPSKVDVPESDLQGFLDEINASCPWLELDLDDVALSQCGLVLFGENQPGAEHLSYGKRSLLVDHAKSDAIDGLVTLIGVRYTTARSEAEKALRLVCRKLGREARDSRSERTHLFGGDFESVEALTHEAGAARPAGVSDASLTALLQNHGSAYGRVFDLARRDGALAGALPGSDTLRAEIVHAARAEMAVRLDDAVMRRTDLGTAGHPGDAALEASADLMAAELGWNAARRSEELARVRAIFPTRGGGSCAR